MSCATVAQTQHVVRLRSKMPNYQRHQSLAVAESSGQVTKTNAKL